MEVKDLQTVLDSLQEGSLLFSAVGMTDRFRRSEASIALVRQWIGGTANRFCPCCGRDLSIPPATASIASASCLNDAYHKSVPSPTDEASIASAVLSCRLCGGCHDSINCSR